LPKFNYRKGRGQGRNKAGSLIGSYNQGVDFVPPKISKDKRK